MLVLPERRVAAIDSRILFTSRDRPFLGWKEFAPDYVGSFRQTTQVMRDINLRIPSMLRQVFPNGLHSELQYVYDNGVDITEGVLTFKDVTHVE